MPGPAARDHVKANKRAASERRERWSETQSASGILKRLADHGEGKIELSATQIKSYEVILDRLVPKLTAVEQTIVDARDNKTEEEILLELQGLISAKPELLDKLLALRQAPTPQPPAATHEAPAAQQ